MNLFAGFLGVAARMISPVGALLARLRTDPRPACRGCGRGRVSTERHFLARGDHAFGRCGRCGMDWVMDASGAALLRRPTRADHDALQRP